MRYSVRIANESDALLLYRVSISAHLQSYYDSLIPEHNKERFHNRYRWSKAAEEKFAFSMIQKILDPDWRVAIAVSGETVLGYILAQIQADGGIEIKGLFVDPTAQGHGIGSALFELSMTWVVSGKTIRLTVIEANTVARKLYQKHGFVVDNERGKNSFYGAETVSMCRVAY